jgi:hypothetical protein
MRGMIKVLRTLPILLLLAMSCSHDRPSASMSVPDYAPLSPGRFNDFDVTRTTYSEIYSPEIRQYVSRQAVTDSVRDSNNRLIFKLGYFVLNDGVWKLDSVTAVWRTHDSVIRQENGKPVLIMLFPLSDGSRWNGNYYNNVSELLFYCVHAGRPLQAGLLNFPETVTIIRQDDSTLLSRKKYIEIYARNVGLIKTEKIFLDYCSTPDCRGKGIIQSGWTELSTIKNFGE